MVPSDLRVLFRYGQPPLFPRQEADARLLPEPPGDTSPTTPASASASGGKASPFYIESNISFQEGACAGSSISVSVSKGLAWHLQKQNGSWSKCQDQKVLNDKKPMNTNKNEINDAWGRPSKTACLSMYELSPLFSKKKDIPRSEPP